jgi:hypothetical protein
MEAQEVFHSEKNGDNSVLCGINHVWCGVSDM